MSKKLKIYQLKVTDPLKKKWIKNCSYHSNFKVQKLEFQAFLDYKIYNKKPNVNWKITFISLVTFGIILDIMHKIKEKRLVSPWCQRCLPKDDKVVLKNRHAQVIDLLKAILYRTHLFLLTDFQNLYSSLIKKNERQFIVILTRHRNFSRVEQYECKIPD